MLLARGHGAIAHMDGFDPATSFGPDVAARYDNVLRGDEEQAVAFLAERAGAGPALELAVGTGRIALPLAATGIQVDGIEQSAAMAAVLAGKPGGSQVAVTMGDMSRADAPGGPYELVYLVYNTIGNLLTQDDQVRCFSNAARHLSPSGTFVVETGTGWGWFSGRTSYVDAEQVSARAVVLDVNRFDPASQILEENHVHISAEGIRMDPIAQRVAPPGELDLMARIAGLQLTERYGWWDGRPFEASCPSHVSVYRRPTAEPEAE
ncbi:class I SAM-dependent DNA methyltransferase [Ruania albidiflava]|uniref:class I SAM-dependent DNA methyltransferase n=1 Tax=Ruania albidiflava TaxID=366586 RepID=UPI0023F2F816|nr:class I SAM-dependent methyltransferase [Ruania albidiflava]